jgi:hypothetical protein
MVSDMVEARGFRCAARAAAGRAAAWLGGVLLAATLLVGMPGIAAAQDGHDHGGGGPRTINVAPRTETRIGNQEAVLAYDRNKLVLFLQRYSDGQPTTGAEIEMTIDFVPVSFEEVVPGTYVASDVMLPAGRSELEMTYKIGDKEGTENMVLILPQAGVQLASARQMSIPQTTVSGFALAGIALAIYAAVTALLALRSRLA